MQMKHVIMATIALKGLGGLLFIFSSSVGAYLLVCIFFSPFVLHLCLSAWFFSNMVSLHSSSSLIRLCVGGLIKFE